MNEPVIASFADMISISVTLIIFFLFSDSNTSKRCSEEVGHYLCSQSTMRNYINNVCFRLHSRKDKGKKGY